MAVVVLGMHRSGTSAVTELLEGAGLAGAGDLSSRRSQWNAHGNRELRPLTRFNARVLGALGGRWDAPPPLPPGWTARRELAALRDEGVRLYREHVPPSGVWKDPRLCLLLPYWEDILGVTFPIVFVHRHPAEVADSLARRDALSADVALALWERYARSALQASEGHQLFTARYDDAMTDPSAFVDRARAALESFAVPLGEPAPASMIEQSIDPELRHAVAGEETTIAERLSDEQRGLVEAIQRLPDATPSLRLGTLGPETPTTEGLLAAHGRTKAAEVRPSRLRRFGRSLRRRTSLR